ncbi:hypothetical protein M409DRAFT_29286 [Zasmidium cellare ATCC 36951]|uniref:Cupin type-2 domain-containing protein n=1 Tax=Zasmidium cellare ATCC 36951 TaxID=1080233 RepID=A0A6A6BZJ9_ZASCE|nr:uncharacterized protein M409DRAFT_29286 [Zasmidium cellare ATCC 36951]KAF2160201.1 hypothetical protein M409DRAFT_29286 [Zasmidium cellare ATCC 36951]
MAESIHLRSRVEDITAHWSPQHLLTIDDSHSFKIAKIKGSFIWHSHPHADEVFYCVSGGPMKIELSTEAKSPEEADKLGVNDVVELQVGDLFRVPKGVQHRPVADSETGILVVEKIGTVNTGDREGDKRTVYVDEGEKKKR